MSKSGNYNMGEIEKRDELIQELADALRYWVPKDEPYPFAPDPKLVAHKKRWQDAHAILGKLEP